MKSFGVDRGEIKRALRPHVIVYCGAIFAFFVADYFMAGPLWFYWPAMLWGTVLGAHVLYCKSIDVDENWAERRARDLRMKSYDLGHIRAIDESYRKRTKRIETADRETGPAR